VLTIDDDVGGRYAPPSRAYLLDRLRTRGDDARAVDAAAARGAASLVIALYSDVRAWKRRAALSAQARQRVDAALASAPDATVVLFGHPRMARGVAARRLAVAWGGESLMQEAAADWIAARRA
jgi:hypothetical protein